ncbi:MAG TPA: VCBS repeat-containing protein, partial [Bryobacteraceae bacterium]
MQRLSLTILAAGFAVLLGFAAAPAFDIVPLETVSETSSNASIGDLNGDGKPDIVLVKGRHWQLTTKIFFGDGKGHFVPGPALPSNATKSYSGSL